MDNKNWRDDWKDSGEGDELSDKAADLVFIAPLIEPNVSPRTHNVSTRTGPGGFGQYLVKVRLGSKQFFIGHRIADLEIARRFADMATLRFRKYIKRIKWNFSEAQAIADTANTEENGGELAGMLLIRRERLWKNDGIILEEIFQPAPRAPSPKRRTVESRLAALESELGVAKLTLASLQDKVFVLELPPTPTVYDPTPPTPTFPTIWSKTQ